MKLTNIVYNKTDEYIQLLIYKDQKTQIKEHNIIETWILDTSNELNLMSTDNEIYSQYCSY